MQHMGMQAARPHVDQVEVQRSAPRCQASAQKPLVFGLKTTQPGVAVTIQMGTQTVRRHMERLEVEGGAASQGFGPLIGRDDADWHAGRATSHAIG